MRNHYLIIKDNIYKNIRAIFDTCDDLNYETCREDLWGNQIKFDCLICFIEALFDTTHSKQGKFNLLFN